MFELTAWTLDQFQLYLLVLFRMSGVLFLGPFFNNVSFPPTLKVGLAMFVTLLLFPLVSTAGVFVPQTTGALFVAAVVEFSLGAFLGFAANFVFSGVMLSGHFVAQDMGITIANVIDPVSNAQTSVVSQIQFLFASALFVAMGGPNLLVKVFYDSFAAVPLLGFQLAPKAVEHVSTHMMQDMLELSMKMASPVVAGLLIATVAMGFIARTVPEMNIFILGFTLRVGIGLVLMLVSVQMFSYIFEVYVGKMVHDLYVLLDLCG